MLVSCRCHALGVSRAVAGIHGVDLSLGVWLSVRSGRAQLEVSRAMKDSSFVLELFVALHASANVFGDLRPGSANVIIPAGAVIKTDDTVETWGDAASGGDCSTDRPAG